MRKPMQDWLPEIDFGVMSHGFAPHGRDYVLIVQAAGTYEVTLTHVVELHYETRVHDEVWPTSWDDRLTNYAEWEAAGNPRDTSGVQIGRWPIRGSKHQTMIRGRRNGPRA
jgi:hypothetical protein